MVSASATVRVEALPAPARTPPAVVAPGWTTTMLVPRLSSCFFTAALAPSPTATMAISAATPMKTPSMVRAERSLLRASACKEAETTIDRKASAKAGRRPREAAALAALGCDRGLGAAVRAVRRRDGDLMLVRQDLAVAHDDHPVGIGGDVRLRGSPRSP